MGLSYFLVWSSVTILSVLYKLSLLAHQVLDKVLSDLALVYIISLTRLWY